MLTSCNNPKKCTNIDYELYNYITVQSPFLIYS